MSAIYKLTSLKTLLRAIPRNLWVVLYAEKVGGHRRYRGAGGSGVCVAPQPQPPVHHWPPPRPSTSLGRRINTCSAPPSTPPLRCCHLYTPFLYSHIRYRVEKLKSSSNSWNVMQCSLYVNISSTKHCEIIDGALEQILWETSVFVNIHQLIYMWITKKIIFITANISI